MIRVSIVFSRFGPYGAHGLTPLSSKSVACLFTLVRRPGHSCPDLSGALVRAFTSRFSVSRLGSSEGFLLLPVGALVNAPNHAEARTVSQRSESFLERRRYVDPRHTKRQATVETVRPPTQPLMDRSLNISSQWLGGWTPTSEHVSDAVSRITGARALPVFVAYNIPGLDCGLYSAGGANGSNAYKRWIREFADGIGNRKAVVILEPDALAGMTCLSPALQQERLNLIHDAVRVLKAKGAAVYIDAGHARWVPPGEMANRLNRAGIADANGFSLNISNFLGTAVNITYGTEVSRRVGGKHFIIDTSRNGQNRQRRQLVQSDRSAPRYRADDATGIHWWMRTLDQDRADRTVPAAAALQREVVG